jgi:UDP-galactopyranose mutase
MKVNVLVVGAGYAGSVVAERLASAGRRVMVVDKRPHVGGNAHDEYDEHGVLIHRYGPHIFHTNSRRIVEYLSNFTRWRPYEHHALACVDGKLLPIPINLDTVNGFYGLDLREEEVGAFFERIREPRSPVLTSEDVPRARVGYEGCGYRVRAARARRPRDNVMSLRTTTVTAAV